VKGKENFLVKIKKSWKMKKYFKEKKIERTLENCANSNLEANERRSLKLRRVLTLSLMKGIRLEIFIWFSVWRKKKKKKKKRLVCSYSFLTFSHSQFSSSSLLCVCQLLPLSNPLPPQFLLSGLGVLFV
jgi:hypothetical protein